MTVMDGKRGDPCMQAERITLGFTGAERLEVNDQDELVVHMGGRRCGCTGLWSITWCRCCTTSKGREGGALPRLTNGALRSNTPYEKE